MHLPAKNVIFVIRTFKLGFYMKRNLLLALWLGVACALPTLAQTASGDLPCLWHFDKSRHAAHAATFINDGYLAADDRPEATLRYLRAEGNAPDGFVRTLGKSHNPAVQGGAAGDCWLFTVPVDSLGRGERIGIDFLFGNDASAAKYYRLEYFERGRWLPAGRLLRASEAPDVRYTHRLFASGEGNSYKVLGSIRLRDALVRDTLRIRWVQAADLRADDGRAVLSDSLGASGFYNAHGLGVYIRRLGARQLSRPRKVLFIGNSYTYYNLVPGIVRELAAYAGRDLHVEMFTIPGCTMERHLKQADCRDLIERGGYDFVVLQDQSLHPALIGTPDDRGIVDRMEAIVAHVRKHNPKARPFIEMTWGRRDGYTEGKFDYDFLTTYAAMQERIRVNSLAEAEAVGGGCIPVGVAWSRVRTERPDIELYISDGSHASYAGSYLAAAVICATLTGEGFGSSPSDGLLDPDTAAYLRRVAEETVLNGR